MFAMNKRLTATLILTLMLAATATAQQAAPVAERKEPDFVQEKGFKSKIFEIKNREPHELASVIAPLGSGFKGATLSYNNDFRTITVRDFPENIATMEEAIKRLDVPQSVHPESEIEFHIHILVASNAAVAGEEFPAELNDVVKQLQGTLKYKSYAVMASAVHRATGNGNGVSNNGVAESKLFNVNTPNGNPIFYNYGLERIRLSAAGTSMVGIGSFRFSIRVPLNLGGQQIQYENVGFNTPVTLREGEKVVVGTTTMGDKGLVVVVSARFLSK
jgi:Bacterial type II/III secretion system short domain